MQASWQVDDIDVHATFSRPAGAGPFPGVVMVAGSGPTDRNWNSPLIPGSNGSAALLSQILTADSFATLRYDKRASGPHVKENIARLAGKISMQGHLDELAGGVRWLAARDDVNPRRLIALTNSEGCIHALNYQLQAKDPPFVGPPFAGLVLTAPPARAVGAVARSQIAGQLQNVPGGEVYLAAYDSAMRDFAAGQPVKVDETLPETLLMVIRSVTAPLNQPFSRELWVTSPATLLAQVTVPVLIVIGKQDIQVDWQVDGGLWEELAREHHNLTIVYPEHANHVLKREPKPKAQLTAAEVTAHYNADDAELDEQTVSAITTWLDAHR
jgi:pimeloyl-ACP methyl ester carboxylesterase